MSSILSINKILFSMRSRRRRGCHGGRPGELLGDSRGSPRALSGRGRLINKNGADFALARLATCQSHPRRLPTPFGANARFLQKRVSRARDPTRRLGGALAAQRAVSDRSWIDLAACKERRRMELTLGHHGAMLDLAAAAHCADIPFGARITLRCPWILAGVIPCL